MRFEWTFWDFAKEYVFRVVGLWLVILSTFSLIVHLIIKFWLGKDIPIEYWILLVVVGIFVAQAWVYFRISGRQIPADRVEKALKAVSNLREEAVIFRNEELPKVNTKQKFMEFTIKYKEWRDKLISEVGIISPSYAHLFRVLDKYKLVIPQNWNEISDLDQERIKTADQISEYTKRIYHFVAQFSRENLSNRVKK